MLNSNCTQSSSANSGSGTLPNQSSEGEFPYTTEDTPLSSQDSIGSSSPEGFSASNMDQEAENMRGIPTPCCKTSAINHPRERCTEQEKLCSDNSEPTLKGDGDQIQKIAQAVRTIIECVGENPEREGLRTTPERYAKAMLDFTKGYSQNVESLVNGAVFHENHDELVIVKNIDVFSLCEHHLVPFIGKMHIGYLPDGRILGLSKVARLAEMFSRRFQIQERLTKEVAMTIFDVLKPKGVGVIMESSHLCMAMRGVQKVGSTTTTSYMVGCMRSDTEERDKFLALLRSG